MIRQVMAELGSRGGKRSHETNWSGFASLDQVHPPPVFLPIHIFCGAANKVIPLARGRECERLHRQTIDIIEGGGHLVDAGEARVY